MYAVRSPKASWPASAITPDIAWRRINHPSLRANFASPHTEISYKPNMNKECSLKLTCIALIAGAAMLAAAGCSHQEPTTMPSDRQAANPPAQVTLPQVATKDQAATENPDQLVQGKTIQLKPGSLTPAKDALDQLASEPKSPLPKGTKVLA